MQKIYQPALLLSFLVSFFLISFADATEQDKNNAAKPNVECKQLDEFHAFKDGMKALREKDIEFAFNVFCSLAIQGDDRAQFRLAEILSAKYESNIPENLSLSYAWAKLAKARFQSVRKTELFESILRKIEVEERAAAESVFISIAKYIPTGFRIDQARTDIDLAAIYAEYNKKLKRQTYTGSRLKREHPAGFLKKMNVN